MVLLDYNSFEFMTVAPTCTSGEFVPKWLILKNGLEPLSSRAQLNIVIICVSQNYSCNGYKGALHVCK